MIPDYHIHTPLCKHAEGSMKEFLAAAIRCGLPEMCFTDHAPNPDNYDARHRMSVGEFESYKAEVASLAAPAGKTRVLFGVEADYYHGCERFLRKWLPHHSLDLVIGSIHYIKSWGFDNPDERQVWDSVDVAGTWREYFDLVGKLADTHLFDVFGHLDLPKKFGYTPGDNAIREMARPAMEKIARAGMAVEINTSGLHRPVREIYPSLALLALAREHGVPICFGSDAHCPGEVGRDFALGLDWARKAGFTEAVRFSARHKKAYTLPKNGN
ncbi:MAG: histidinol-phosphatase HisJ family protein [Kiritimatiellia bacterium]